MCLLELPSSLSPVGAVVKHFSKEKWRGVWQREGWGGYRATDGAFSVFIAINHRGDEQRRHRMGCWEGALFSGFLSVVVDTLHRLRSAYAVKYVAFSFFFSQRFLQCFVVHADLD